MGKMLNTETADYTKPVEKRVSIMVGDAPFTFSVWCNRYVFDHLSQDNWMRCGERLRDHVREDRQKQALTGTLFLAPEKARESICESAENAMRHFVQDEFRREQVKAGNLEWQTDSLLAGEEYRV
jgi:hypothetical protein